MIFHICSFYLFALFGIGLIWRDSNSLISSSADNKILLDELKNPHIPAKDAVCVS